MNSDNEQDLIHRAQKGDREAVTVLVDSYAPMIYRFAFNVCRNKDKAENTTQETFLSLLRKLDQFDGRSKFSTWLYTIVSNHCLMMARSEKTKRFVSLDDDESPLLQLDFESDDSDPHERLEQTELRARLDEAIDQLSPDYRLVFLLRDVEGLSTEEVSEVTNLSVPAVKSRLHRARVFLRNQLLSLLRD